MNRFAFVGLLLCLLATATSSRAQESALYVPRDIQRAYESDTRSMDGRPGARYWQNRADYDVNVRFDPVSGLLEGTETINYFNNSPDTLRQLVLNVIPNHYRRGSARDYDIDPADAGKGLTFDAISVAGEGLDLSNPADVAADAERSGALPPGRVSAWYETNNGLKFIILTLIPPDAQVTLSISWHYTVNRGSHIRTGAVDSTSYFIAYFFPRIAVYDDIDGWDLTPHTGNPEFYNDFGDFQVTIDVPRHFVVWATGLLQNADDVLAAPYSARYRAAFASDTVVHVIDAVDVADGEITAASGRNRWRFAAENVSDFAFGVSDHYLWDATSLVVDSASGRRVLVEAAYNDSSADFHDVVGVARAAIEIMSNEMPGVPFPYPNMTVFNGLSAMEYPMMVNDRSVEGRERLIQLTSHEILHTYFPFYMGTNETKYAWMDEGWARLGDFTVTGILLPDEQRTFYRMEQYRQNMGSYLDVPMYAGSDFTKGPAYDYNSYEKAAVFYSILKDLLGEERFKEVLQEYMRRWNGKHPTPYDFFFAFNDASGQDLGWLYQPWFFEYGYADLAIAGVTRDDDVYRVVIERVGRHPVPVHLRIGYTDGSSSEKHAPVSVWKDGNRTWTFELPADREIRFIELGGPVIPDADPSNNRFTRSS